MLKTLVGFIPVYFLFFALITLYRNVVAEKLRNSKIVKVNEVDALFRMARGDKDVLEQLKNFLNSKKAEYKQRLKAAADQAVQQVKDYVKQQGQQAMQDALQGKQPSIHLPSLPSTRGLKLPDF
jgi:hypothetical protein